MYIKNTSKEALEGALREMLSKQGLGPNSGDREIGVSAGS